MAHVSPHYLHTYALHRCVVIALNSINEHTQSRLSACLLVGVLYINQMYTVTYFEVNCEDRNPEVTQEFFTTYHEAKAYAKSFEEWDDVRVDYLQVNTELVSY